MKRNHTINHAGIEFHASTQALAIANVSQYRLSTAIDMAKQLEPLSYANIRAHYESGNLASFLMSLAPSEMAIVINNTITALAARGITTDAQTVYNKYAATMDKYRAHQEAERMELVKLEAEHDCPEAIDEMNSRWQDVLVRYI